MALEQTQRRRQAVGTIHDVVGAMRAIAAGRIQGAQRALTAARTYREVVLRAIRALANQATASRLPATEGAPPLLVVLTSEQPLCGSFNQDVLALAERHWDGLSHAGKAKLLVIGQRGVRQWRARGIVPTASDAAATSLHGLRDLVKRQAGAIDHLFAARAIGALHVVYSRYKSVSEQIPTHERILPLELSRLGQATDPPTSGFYRYLPVPDLLAGLVSEYAFISLFQTAADSFASEQASRLVAMDGATRNTQRMLETLQDLERRERQGQITRQVLELISARFATG